MLGAVLRIDPFDEPNVQESKDRTRRILEEFERTESSPPASRPAAIWESRSSPSPTSGRASSRERPHPSLEMVLQRFLGRARAGEYVALLAYLPRNAASEASFALMRRAIRNALRVPVLQGYGPRYLHSIGQLYKGGPGTGLFLLLTAAGTRPAGPREPWTFGEVEMAQALGDAASLESRGKPVLRLHLTRGRSGLEALGAAVERAIAASLQAQSLS